MTDVSGLVGWREALPCLIVPARRGATRWSAADRLTQTTIRTDTT